MEEYNKLLNKNNEYLNLIKIYEDDEVGWNIQWKAGIFQFPFDNGIGVTAEYEKMALDSMDIRKYLDKIKFSSKRGNEISEYMFITINPDPSLNLTVKSIYDKLCKLCKSTRILEYLYTIEQRGDTDDTMGNGIHSHVLIKHKFPKFCKLQQHFYNGFKTVIGNIKHIDIKHCKNVRDVSHRINYINGEKKDNEKIEKVLIDRKWRQQWGIQNVYGNLKEPQSVAS
jgi:hypothetical protein